MFKPDSICPLCEEEGTVSIIKDDVWTYTHAGLGETYRVEGITCCHCSACNEKYIQPGMDKLNLPKITDAKRKLEGLMTSQEIEGLLQSLPFSQKQLEELLGIGEHSFSRWKSGSVTQNAACDNLLYLISSDPSLLERLALRHGQSLTPRKKGRPSKGKANASKRLVRHSKRA
jgi:putative zinc finger/helix-turn-helix YgiT family protein